MAGLLGLDSGLGFKLFLLSILVLCIVKGCSIDCIHSFLADYLAYRLSLILMSWRDMLFQIACKYL